VLDPSVRGLSSLLAPPRCGCCGREVPAGAPLCGRCRDELDRAEPILGPGPPGAELAVAAGAYRGALRALAHGLKFGRLLALAPLGAALILRACPPAVLRGAVVPVPPAPLRWRWRGFDAAEELALALADATGLELVRCLRRAGGPRQVGRSRRRRLADPPRVRAAGTPPPRALLVDDVLTTGATVAACADALRAAGCREVVALTLARSPSAADRMLAPLGESGTEAYDLIPGRASPGAPERRRP
jgi:predicted amidophosphoribosyltransferase